MHLAGSGLGRAKLVSCTSEGGLAGADVELTYGGGVSAAEDGAVCVLSLLDHDGQSSGGSGDRA
jgi:hypothetical protein